MVVLVSQATQPGIESEAAVGPACPPQPSRKQTERAFSVSMVVSGLRCVLTYVILPFVTPFLGLAPGVGPVLGLTFGTVAIAANVYSIRRFSRAEHPWRRPVTAIHIGVIAFLLVLMTNDLLELVA